MNTVYLRVVLEYPMNKQWVNGCPRWLVYLILYEVSMLVKELIELLKIENQDVDVLRETEEDYKVINSVFYIGNGSLVLGE